MNSEGAKQNKIELQHLSWYLKNLEQHLNNSSNHPIMMFSQYHSLKIPINSNLITIQAVD